MSERIVLDPEEEATGRVEFDITPFIGSAGPDWGDAAIELYMAEAARGQIPIDYRVPNRTITIPLNLLDRGDLAFEEVRTMMQAKTGLFQREGGWIKREINGAPWYADVVNATLKMGGSTTQALLDVDADAVLTLDTLPDWYGEEIDLGTKTATHDLAATFEPGKGDHPGRARIIVADTAGANRRGLIWGIRSRHYDDAATAALAYDIADLTPLDETITVGPPGGYELSHSDLGTTWTPIFSTDLRGVGPLTHTGSYRVWASLRVGVPNIRVRFAWGVGDTINPTINSPVTLPYTPEAHYLIDLGSIRIDRAPAGDHQWRGILQAAGVAGGEGISSLRLWLQPLDEYAGTLSSRRIPADGIQAFIARDEFNQSAGNLNGKTAAVGGNWATSGDATDLAVESTGKTAQRTQVSDSTANTGRFAISSATAVAAVAVQIDFKQAGGGLGSTWPSNALFGVIARHVDSNNWAGLFLGGTLSGASLAVCRAGSVARSPIAVPAPTQGYWYTIRLVIDDDGYWYAWIVPQGTNLREPNATGLETDFATGGDLESGQVGFYDCWQPSAAVTRNYDNFAAWAPELDAVVYADRALQVRTDAAIRESPSNSYAGVATVRGDAPRIPSPGLEMRPLELLVKPSRGDLDQLPDQPASNPNDQADDVTVQVLYRPCWLFVPDGGPGS